MRSCARPATTRRRSGSCGRQAWWREGLSVSATEAGSLSRWERGAERTARADSKLINQSLVVVDQHPADGGEADDYGGRDRPAADADVADRLPFGFIPRDLAVARLV